MYRGEGAEIGAGGGTSEPDNSSKIELKLLI